MDSVFAKNPGAGIRDNPSLSDRIRPSSTDKACIKLLLLPEATEIKNKVLNVKNFNVTLFKGSNGYLHRVSRTKPEEVPISSLEVSTKISFHKLLQCLGFAHGNTIPTWMDRRNSQFVPGKKQMF